MGQINLDQARVARREGKGDAPTVVLNGKTYTLPVELPTEALTHTAQMASDDSGAQVEGMKGLVRTLFDGQYDEFMADAPFLGDLEALLTGALAEYGVTQGESQASPES